VQEVIARLKRGRPNTPQLPASWQALIRYDSENAGRMRYDEYLRLGYGIGRGAPERQLGAGGPAAHGVPRLSCPVRIDPIGPTGLTRVWPMRQALAMTRPAVAVPADLRARLEAARLDLRALFRALDRMDLTPSEIPQRLWISSSCSAILSPPW
jgi:hypothetical protein